MTAVVTDIYFLNIEDAYAEAAKQQHVVNADSKQRLQFCYYDGPLTDITLENLIRVEQELFVEFFSHNHLPLPELLGLSNAGQVVYNTMPVDILEEIRQQRTLYKIGGYIHFDSYFVDPLLALNVSKQQNRVDCGHPTIDGLQICYYRGELPKHSIANLIHLELESFEEFFVRSRLRIPENVELPDELESEVKAAVREELKRLIGEVKRKRNWLSLRLFEKAKSLATPRIADEKPRLFVPANRLTTVMQYSSRGIANAFATMGWEVLLYIEANDMEGTNLVDILKKYLDFAPHACFQINNLNNAFIHDQIVNMIWWQDLMQLRHKLPMNWRANDYCFSISPIFDEYLQVCQAHSVQRLHFVIDEQLFHNRTPIKRENKVVFVGSSYLPVVDFNNPQHQKTVDQLLSMMRAGARFDRPTVAVIAAANGLEDDFVFWKLLHYVIRDYAVKWLCGSQGYDSVEGGRTNKTNPESIFTVEVYGRFWDQDAEVAQHFRGELPHGEAVADVYRGARYALVCHPFEINSQRLAEVAACGCIPLVYDCRDVAEPPHWDEYCLFFKTEEQLKQILRQGLQPKLPPEGLAANFTYRHAAEKVADHCGLKRMPLVPTEQCCGTISLLAEQYGNRLLLQSHDSALLQRCRNNLQTNLQSLRQHRPSIYQFLIEAWSRLDCSIELDRDIAGQPWQVAIRHNNQEIFRLDNLSWLEHKLMIAENATKLNRENTCCYGLVGLGAGYELLEAFAATTNPIPEMAEFEVAIYLIEADPLFWLLNLLLHDWQVPLAAKRLQIFHQEDCWPLLAKQFERFEAPLPDMLFSLNSNCEAIGLRLLEAIEQAKQSRAERHRQNLQQVADYYAAIDIEQWRQKFHPENSGQLRVMGFISRFSSFLKYCMRDWLDGFERLDATTLCSIESENYHLSTIESLIDDINRFKPDLILTIDHFRHEYQGVPENIPFVNWIQDMLPNITGNQTAITERDFTFVFSRDWLAMNGGPLYSAYPAEHLPVGFNDHYYHPEQVEFFEYDFLVISHLVDPEQTFLAFENVPAEQWQFDHHESALLDRGIFERAELVEIYRCLITYLRGLSANQHHQLRVDSQSDGFAAVVALLNSHGMLPDAKAVNVLLAGSGTRFHFDYLLRMKTAPIAALIDAGLPIKLALYGRNWDRFDWFAPYAKGIADNGEFINHLMNCSKICFNGSPGTTLHMHALEIMATGAFMLSRAIYKDGAPLADYYDEHEVAYYKDEANLVEKVKYYLANGEIRRKIAERAYQKTVGLFSYQAISGRVLDSICNRFVGN